MSNLTAARRYARALLEEADRVGLLDEVDDDMQMIRQSLDDVRELSRFVNSPVIPEGRKKSAMKALFENRVTGLTLRFLLLLIEKDRETILSTITDTYRRLRDEQENVVPVQARVAQPLDDEERSRLVERLESMTGQQVRLEVEHTPELLGGLVVRIGDTVYDGSVRQKLQNLRAAWSKEQTPLDGATNGSAG